MAFVPLNTNNSNLANYNSVNSLMLDYQGFKKAVNNQSAEGWVSGVLPSVSSVSYNGNRSYDVTFAGDVSSYLSPGMRLKTVRQVAAPTYSAGALNGTSQYFTKTTPSGTLGTATNNFTFMGWVYLTAYGTASTIAARMDSTAANGIFFRIESSGIIGFGVINGGASNYRFLTSAQSIPLNKWVHIAATWTSGTVTMYIDGVLVPMNAATTSGTAPTTAGTGGDFSIGRYGGYNGLYFPGYINGVGVFNAVLTASTIKSYISQVLSGSETNCIGAWSLNNTANDQNSAGNNLTAQGSAGFSSLTPYSTNGSGTATSTDDYAIITKVASAVATVQVAEGCTIPTTGGISATYISTQKAPFNMPMEQSKWTIQSILRVSSTTNSPVASTGYEASGLRLYVPVGAWVPSLTIDLQTYRATNGIGEVWVVSSLSANVTSNNGMTELFNEEYNDVSNSPLLHLITKTITPTSSVKVSAATTYYINYYTGVSGMGAIGIRGDRTPAYHNMLLAYL